MTENPIEIKGETYDERVQRANEELFVTKVQGILTDVLRETERKKTERTVTEMAPEELAALEKFAKWAVAGGFAGRNRSFEAAMCAILYGAEVGLTPNQSLQCINVIDGRANMEVEAKAALVVSKGYPPPKKWVENEDQRDKAVGYCECTRDGTTIRREFSYAQAAACGLAGKPNWKGYWPDMLKYRAEDRAIDDLYPDIVKGIAGAENLDPGHPVEEVRVDVEDMVKEKPPWQSEKTTHTKPATSKEPSTVSDARGSSGPSEAADTSSSAPTEKRRRGRPRKTAQTVEKKLDPPKEEPSHSPNADSNGGSELPIQYTQEELWETWKNLRGMLEPNHIFDLKRSMRTELPEGLIHPSLPAETLQKAISLARRILGASE